MSRKGAQKKGKGLEKEEVVSLLKMLADLMNAYSSFAGNLGKIQKTNSEAYKQLFSLKGIERLPEMLSELATLEGEPAELGRLLISVYSKMATYLPRITNIMDLSPDDKIRLSEGLKSLAHDFRKLQDWATKEETN